MLLLELPASSFGDGIYGDTIGLSDPKETNLEIAMNMKKLILTVQGGVNCIIVVLRYGRLSKEERANLELISKIFDYKWASNCIVVATHYDKVSIFTDILHAAFSYKSCMRSFFLYLHFRFVLFWYKNE